MPTTYLKTTRPRTHHPAAWRSAGLQPVFACRLSFARAPWASGWRAGDAALSAQRRVPDGVRPRVTRELRSGCVAVSLAECLVLWFCVSLLCDRHRPSSVHPYRVGVPVVGRTVFRLPINQSIPLRSGRTVIIEKHTADASVFGFWLGFSHVDIGFWLANHQTTKTTSPTQNGFWFGH